MLVFYIPFPLENCSSGNGKAPCWFWNILSLIHAFFPLFMLVCKILACAREKKVLAPTRGFFIRRTAISRRELHFD